MPEPSPSPLADALLPPPTTPPGRWGSLTDSLRGGLAAAVTSSVVTGLVYALATVVDEHAPHGDGAGWLGAAWFACHYGLILVKQYKEGPRP